VASIVRCRSPGGGLRISRCGLPTLRITRLFPVIASARLGRRSMLSTPEVRLQRLLTSRAHRLRKPHRTTRPLTPSVAGRALNRAIHAHFNVAFRPRPARHRARHRGVSTTAIPLPGRLRWFNPRSRDRGRLARALFYVCSRSPRTLFTHRESAPVVSTGTAASSYPGWLHEPFGPRRPAWEDASTQPLQPTSDTSTPQIVWSSNHRLHRLSPVRVASTPPAGPKPWRRA
jgi:hypothetical protein